MGELHDAMDGSEDAAVSETGVWIGRVTAAASDFETVDPEAAADLGL